MWVMDSTQGREEKTNPTISHFFIFHLFLKIVDFIYVKKSKAKKFIFVFHKKPTRD
jgi:hypothetical protein